MFLSLDNQQWGWFDFCLYLSDQHNSLGFRKYTQLVPLCVLALATACSNCWAVIVVGGLDVVARAWLKQSCAYFSVVYKYSRFSSYVSFCFWDCLGCRDVMVRRIWRRGERRREALVWTTECLNADTKLRMNKRHICFVIISRSSKEKPPNELFLSSYRCTVRSCSSGN